MDFTKLQFDNVINCLLCQNIFEMGSEASLNDLGDVYNKTRYSLERNSILDDVILSLPNLFLYAREYIVEDQSRLLTVLTYSFAASALLGFWYFLFWRPFDWNRVNKY